MSFFSLDIVGQCWLCDQSRVDHCGLCSTCFNDLPRLPPHNLRPLTRPDYCHIWVAPLSFQPPADRWLYRFKYHSTPALASHFAVLLAAQIIAYHKQSRTPLPDAVCAVPMSWRRWRQRGFNQARELATATAKVLGLPVLDRLIRVGGEHQQHQLDWAARQANADQAFAHCGRACGCRHVAIVDDVITTGATLTAAARVLLENGVEQVSGWALAYTPAEHHGED
ncbi:ComF family protein [Aliidiomarina sedimenti]|uniref:ComF family protein n=1 Tax=Aliidiomarina sedimenti TaxID=1933879 RepID=UPI000F87229A|nr:hypothetical protein [Aliidiomarina sedimenti]